MKTIAFTAAAAALALAGCASIPENSKPYSCAEYNAMRAKVAANPSEAYLHADTLRFSKINMVGFRTALDKHPNRERTMTLIDDNTDLQALQCRLAPDAIIHYTAEQVTPASVRLGYEVEYPSGKPEGVKAAEYDFKVSGKPVPNEKGMEPVKQLIQNCAAKTAPAQACKLGGL